MTSRVVAPNILLSLLVTAACAGGPRTGDAASCLLAAADSTFLSAGPVFRDCAVDRKAKLIPATARPDFQPPSGAVQVGTTCYSAEVRLVVGANGWVEPGTARLVRATDPTFGQAILASSPSWRYEPAELDGHAVRQIVQEKQMVLVRVSVSGQGRSSTTPRC